ncbi:MAG: hypothetical protein IJO26_00580 [Clostridium sp.]|nr:hypothetical protein [Clostridium sp.]
MSDSIFEIDYSSCDNFEREIKSYINYFEEIQDLLSDVETYISNVTDLNGLWSTEVLNNNIYYLKSAIDKEISRYSNFQIGFNNFYSPIESIDSNLESMINNQLKFVEDNKDYNVYITLLKFNQVDVGQDQLYNILIDQGLSQEEAMKISLLFNPETKRLIEELSNLNESELQKALEDLNNKLIKSPEEVLLIDILSMDKNSARVDVVNQINDIIASRSVASWINSKYVGKDINQFNLDIKAIDGQITHLEQKISRSQLGKSKVNIMKSELDDLKNIRSTKISKSTKLSNATTSVGKWAGRIAVACQVAEISTEQYENYFKNGDELDDVVVAAGIDVAGIVASGIAGSQVGGLIGSGGGPIGTVIGIVGGFLITAFAGYIYNVFIDPILTDLYNNIIEPSSYWIGNKINDLEDWWDILCW